MISGLPIREEKAIFPHIKHKPDVVSYDKDKEKCHSPNITEQAYTITPFKNKLKKNFERKKKLYYSHHPICFQHKTVNNEDI